MKKILALLLVVILTATVSISGTLAFVQASAAPVTVDTAGSVEVEQFVYHRTIITEDNTQTCTLNQRVPTEVDGNTVNASFALYPAIYPNNEPDKKGYKTDKAGDMTMYVAPNAQDEIVLVKNTGSAATCVRTWFAIECGTMSQGEFESVIKLNTNQTDWTWDTIGLREINGKQHYVLLATYNTVLQSGAATSPSLLQIMLSKESGNEECAKLAGGSADYALDILIFTQAADRETADPTYSTDTVEGIKSLLIACFTDQLPTKWTTPTNP